MWGLRIFEYFVMALVMGVVVCFCIQLSLIKDQSLRELFRGYAPSPSIVTSTGFVPPYNPSRAYLLHERTDLIMAVYIRAVGFSVLP